jgi:hypothetical protein
LKVKPGDYLLWITHPGFEPPAAPARVHVEAEADPPSLALAMTPWPALGGRVLGPDRQPAGQVPVQLVGPPSGQPSTTVTDANGRFQFDALHPGEYALLARPLNGDETDEDSQLAPTYFPDSTDLSAATHISLKPGDDLSGYDIILRSVPVFRVSGRVLDEAGNPAEGAIVQAASADTRFARVTAGDDGAFELRKVRKGSGRVSVEFHRGETTLRGYARIDVNGHDLENVTMRVSPPLSLFGTAELEGRPVDFKGRAQLEPANELGARVEATIDGGRARFDEVYPGRYFLFSFPSIGGAYLDSVRLGDRDITLAPFDLAEGLPPPRFIMRSDGGAVMGTVTGRVNCLVFLVPFEERLQGFPFISTAPCGNGSFRIDHVRPGEYYALVIDESDLPYLQRVERARDRLVGAQTIKVEKSTVISIDLH